MGYPTAVPSFTTKQNGVNQIVDASHINDLQTEITALEGALLTTGLAHDLKFVDATYDIGKSGATRPRDLFLSRNATIGGTLAVTGVAAFTVAPTVAAGIQFPATQAASANANTLDDYEEGTWTPGLSFGGSATGVTYSAQTGNYIKIGQMVWASANLTITNNGSGTGSARVTGFPFAFTGANYVGVAMIDAGAAGTVNGLNIFGEVNQTTALVYLQGATNSSAATEANLTDTTSIAVFICYKAPS